MRAAMFARVELADIRRVEWLWDSRLPVGYFNLLVGEEGLGKGVLVSWLVAQVTRGTLPGDFEGRPQTVLIVGDEDDFASVWTPRLHAAGADLRRVRRMAAGHDVNLADPHGVAQLGMALDEAGVGFVVFDQLLDHLDGGHDGQKMYNASAVRTQIKPLRKLARDAHDGRGIPTLALLHPIKGQVRQFRDLVSGSHQFNALSRSSLLLALDPDDERGVRRVLVRGKGNLAADPGSFEFDLEGTTFDVDHLDKSISVPVLQRPMYGNRTKADLLRRESRKSEALDALRAKLPAVLKAADQSLADLCRAVGRNPGDRTVKRALEALADAGQAAYTTNATGTVTGWRAAP